MNNIAVPNLYLSTSDGKWRVIYQGMPLCADTTVGQSLIVYERTLQQLRQPIPKFPPVWDGDTGNFRA
jgi:hypothetical protein